MKPKNVINQELPERTPKYGGKIKFPAPKNIAKSAKPNVNISTMLFFLFIIFSLLKNKKTKIPKNTKFCILSNNILQEIQKKLNRKNGFL